MIKKRFLIFSIIIVSLYCETVSAQQTFGNQWFAASIRYKFSKDIFFDFEESWRIIEWSSTSQTFSDFALTYRINKKFRTGIGYRFVQRGGFVSADEFTHRFYADLSFREKFNDLKIVLRSRFQEQYNDPFTSENGKIPEASWRNKIEFSYNLPGPYVPFMAYEHFANVKDLKYPGFYTSRHRFQTGLEYSVNKNLSVSLGYIYQRQVNRKNPERDHVLNVSVSYSINASKSDK